MALGLAILANFRNVFQLLACMQVRKGAFKSLCGKHVHGTQLSYLSSSCSHDAETILNPTAFGEGKAEFWTVGIVTSSIVVSLVCLFGLSEIRPD